MKAIGPTVVAVDFLEEFRISDIPRYRCREAAGTAAAFFAAIILCQVAIVMIWRTSHQSVFSRALLRNRAVLAGIVVKLMLLWAIDETDLGQRLFATPAMPPWAWLIPVPFAVSMLAFAEGQIWDTRRQ